jgi:Geminivirus Rep catalytic domain.
LEDSTKIEKYLIARENHEDGKKHLHVYLLLEKKVNIRDCRYLDLTDDNGRIYHGKYEGCRSDAAVLAYCTKENDYISSYSEDELEAIKNSR